MKILRGMQSQNTQTERVLKSIFPTTKTEIIIWKTKDSTSWSNGLLPATMAVLITVCLMSRNNGKSEED